MIKVYALKRRHVDENENMPTQLKQVKIFSTCVGHGVGTIDFSQKVLELSERDYEAMLESCGEYARFKLGNLSRYFEVEIFIEHAQKLLPQMPECALKQAFSELQEGYLIIKKDF